MNSLKIIFENYKLFNKDPVDGVSIDFDDENPFEWNLIIVGPKDSPYEGGCFKAKMIFPKNFPHSPPDFIFISKIFHPNIYENGKVCISILHEGEDRFGYESADERWRPVHSVNSILLSIISLLHDPNDESPANIDSAKIWREDKNEFQKIVNQCTRESLE